MRYIIISLGVLLVFLAGGLLFLYSVITQHPGTLHGTFLEPAEPIDGFELTSGSKSIHTEMYEGKFVVLVFGYTFCPDVCPATMSRVARAIKQMDDEARNIQVLLVSVDPERDDANRVAEYAASFNPEFVGLTGTSEQIEKVTARFGIHYERAEGSAATDYLVDHTSTVIVLDRKGNIILLWPFDTSSEEMAEDLTYLIEYR